MNRKVEKALVASIAIVLIMGLIYLVYGPSESSAQSQYSLAALQVNFPDPKDQEMNLEKMNAYEKALDDSLKFYKDINKESVLIPSLTKEESNDHEPSIEALDQVLDSLLNAKQQTVEIHKPAKKVVNNKKSSEKSPVKKELYVDQSMNQSVVHKVKKSFSSSFQNATQSKNENKEGNDTKTHQEDQLTVSVNGTQSFSGQTKIKVRVTKDVNVNQRHFTKGQILYITANKSGQYIRFSLGINQAEYKGVDLYGNSNFLIQGAKPEAAKEAIEEGTSLLDNTIAGTVDRTFTRTLQKTKRNINAFVPDRTIIIFQPSL